MKRPSLKLAKRLEKYGNEGMDVLRRIECIIDGFPEICIRKSNPNTDRVYSQNSIFI